MQSETPTVRVVAFRSLVSPNEGMPPLTRLGMQSGLINVVIVQMGGTPSEKTKLRAIEEWLRGQEVRLWKVTKKEAFVQTYRQLLASPLRTFFVSSMLIEDLGDEPLQKLYKQLQGGLESVQKQAQTNLSKIRFIILKDSLQNIDQRNYFHGGIALLTTELQIAQQTIAEELLSLLKLRPQDSCSSINSEQAERYARELQKVEGGIRIEGQDEEREDYELLAKIHDTPGVGHYDITRNLR